MEENKILAYVRGNDVLFIVTVTTPEIDSEGHPVEGSFLPVDFTAWDDYSLRVVKQGVTRTIVAESSQLVEGEEGKIVVDVPYTALCGTYSLELVGRQNGRHERSYEIMMFAIVESNDKANVTYDVIEGYKSTDLDITVQLVQSALVFGENAYQMWKHLPGNEDKTLQDYIDEVLDLAAMTQECNDVLENAKPDRIYEDNYVYRWNPATHSYVKTTIYVKGEQGEQGEQGPQGIQGVQGVRGERGLQGERGEKGDDGVGISGIEYEYTDEEGNNVYNVYTTDEGAYQIVSPRGPAGQDGQDGTDGAPGIPGADGQDGISPHIDPTSGNWYVGSTDTGVHAQGPKGDKGDPGTGSDVQSDWSETDTDDPAYIKNKPTLATVATSGNYFDLTTRPIIPPAPVQSDWNQTNTSSLDFIKNKPDVYEKPATGIPSTDLSSAVQTSLGKADTAVQTETDPTVPSWAKASSKPSYTASEVGALPDDTPLFSGDYNDLSNKPTIPAAQVQSDWNATTGMGVILNKPTIPTVPTNVSAFQNDAGYLTSHQDISGKEDKVDIVSASGATLSAEVGKYYTLSNVGTLAITLPTIAAGTTKVQTVTFYVAAGSTPAVTFTSTHSIYYSDGFEIAASSTYEVSAAYNGIAWVVASVKIVIPT